MTSSSLEARVAHLEGIVEEIRTRLASIEDRLARLEDRLAALEVRMEARMQSNFQWTIGALLSMWISIILAILIKS